MVEICRVYFKKKQLQQYFITICSIHICLLTWALHVVFSFEIHVNSKKKKYVVLISSLLPTSIYLDYQYNYNSNWRTLLWSQHTKAPQLTTNCLQDIKSAPKPHCDSNLRDVEEAILTTYESIQTPDSLQGHTFFMCCHYCHDGCRLMTVDNAAQIIVHIFVLRGV